jgi:hypothetical protein
MSNIKTDYKMILKWIIQELDIVYEEWMQLTQDRDQCMALVNTEMNLRVP